MNINDNHGYIMQLYEKKFSHLIAGVQTSFFDNNSIKIQTRKFYERLWVGVQGMMVRDIEGSLRIVLL